MNMNRNAALLLGLVLLTACEGAIRGNGDKTNDYGLDKKSLSELRAGIWVDPTGCDHWIIDDGLEGYMSQRLTPDGKPVCSGAAPPNHATGNYRRGSTIQDPV
ncbi:MAG: hypothetical protein WBN04_18545 [Paracoccaceae bacterium]